MIPGGEVEDADEDALAGREVVVEDGTGEGGEGFCVERASVGVSVGFGEGGEDVGDPVGSEAGVGVDVGDELASAGGEACLASEGEAFARLVDQLDSGVEVGEDDVAGAVGAGVVDGDDLAGAGGEGAGLGEDGVEAGGKVGLFVISGYDEA